MGLLRPQQSVQERIKHLSKRNHVKHSPALPVPAPADTRGQGTTGALLKNKYRDRILLGKGGKTPNPKQLLVPVNRATLGAADVPKRSPVRRGRGRGAQRGVPAAGRSGQERRQGGQSRPSPRTLRRRRETAPVLPVPGYFCLRLQPPLQRKAEKGQLGSGGKQKHRRYLN